MSPPLTGTLSQKRAEVTGRTLLLLDQPGLDGRAPGRTVGTKYTAVAGFWTEYGTAVCAFVESLADVRAHRLQRGIAALRTGQQRFIDYCCCHGVGGRKTRTSLLYFRGGIARVVPFRTCGHAIESRMLARQVSSHLPYPVVRGPSLRRTARSFAAPCVVRFYKAPPSLDNSGPDWSVRYCLDWFPAELYSQR